MVGSVVLGLLGLLAGLRFVTAPDPPTRATWALVVATVALVLATLWLGRASLRGSRILRDAERELEDRRERSRRREIIERRLAAHFDQPWPEEITRRLKQKGLAHVREVLKPFGTDLEEIEELFPELKSEIQPLRRSNEMSILQTVDPDLYERVRHIQRAEAQGARDRQADEFMDEVWEKYHRRYGEPETKEDSTLLGKAWAWLRHAASGGDSEA